MRKFVLFSLLAIFLLVKIVSAKDCGGAIKCDCGDTLIQSHTMWYDLINCSTGLLVNTDNIFLNCNGHLINGQDSMIGNGIFINYRNLVNITNCITSRFYEGVTVEHSINIILTNLNTSNNYYGLFISSSDENKIEYTNVFNNRYGLYLIDGDNNLIRRNKIVLNEVSGIQIPISSNNKISENSIYNNYWGLVYGYYSYNNTIQYNDILNNKVFNLLIYPSHNISVPYNWWGSSSKYLIDLGIKDYNDQQTLGRVDYEPFLYSGFDGNQVPIVNNLKCYNGSFWKECNAFRYNEKLTKVRVNCTDTDGYIIRAKFGLEDIPYYQILINGNATFSSGYWVYDNPDLILDCNGVLLKATCTDNNSNENTLAIDWLLRGSLPRSILFYEGFNDGDSIPNNNGTPNKIFGLTETKCGKAVDLTSGAYISYPLNGNFPDQSNLTIEFWFKNSKLSSQGFFDIARLYGTHPNSMGIFYSAGVNRVITEIRNNFTANLQAHAPGALVGTKWNHVAVTFSDYNRKDNTFMLTTYFNGNPGSSIPIYKFFPNLSNDFWVGSSGFYGPSYAYMDEFKIYNYAKTPEEIYNDYLYMKECTKEEDLPKRECVIYKPQSTGKVQINCSGLYVDNKPFKANGVGYQPIPIGETANKPGGADIIFNSPKIYNRDFPLLREMNANTIRTWAPVTNRSFLDAAWNNGTNPIYVVMGFWIECGDDFSNPTIRQKYVDNFTKYVNEYKDHPAVLVWALGNEVNLCGNANYIDDYYSLCNALAEAAYLIEGSNYHPVGIVNWDLFHIGQEIYNSKDESLNYIDYWGSNVYPGRDLNSWIEDYMTLSGKPLLITEYGIDALNNSNKEEYEDVHAEWVLMQWNDINNANRTIGSTLMAYSDEWWKGALFYQGTSCPDFSSSYHSDCGYQTTKHPDGFSNEEWWGVMRTRKNLSGIDIMESRQLYYALQYVWGTPTNFNLTLNQGWNLISIPLNIPPIPKSAILNYTIFGYNGTWFIPQEIDNKLGYWVKVDESVNLTISGIEAKDNIELNTGWNLIGHPYLEEKEIYDLYENNIVYSYNGSWSSYVFGRAFNSLTTLKPGYGYWVKEK